MVDLTKKTDFAVVPDDLDKIMQELSKNDDICKLLYFTDAAPYRHNIDDEVKGKIFSDGYVSIIPITQASTIEKNNIIITFDGFMPSFTTDVYMTSVINIDVLCPLTQWKMQDKNGKTTLRPYEMAHIVHTMMNGKKLNGLGRAEFTGAEAIMLPANEYVAGLTLHYSVVNSNDDGYKLLPANR